MANVTLTHTDINSGSATRVLCSDVVISGKRNNDSTPDVNISETPVEVQTLAIENLKYILNDIKITNEALTLTYGDMLSLYKSQSPAVLNITYGMTTVLPSMTGSTSGINVLMIVPSTKLNVRDTKNAKIPISTLTFVETV